MVRARIVCASSWHQSTAPPVEGATRDAKGDWWVELETAEDMFTLASKAGEDIIIHMRDEPAPYSLTVYDTYIE